MHESDIPYEQITKEAVNQYPALKSLFVARGSEVSSAGYSRKDGIMVCAYTSRPFTVEEKTRFADWLKIRLNTDNITLYEFAAEQEKESSGR